jgi:hypothetical protein
MADSNPQHFAVRASTICSCSASDRREAPPSRHDKPGFRRFGMLIACRRTRNIAER